MTNSSNLVNEAISPTMLPYNLPRTVLTSRSATQVPRLYEPISSVHSHSHTCPTRELLRCHAKNAFTDEAHRHRGTWNYLQTRYRRVLGDGRHRQLSKCAQAPRAQAQGAASS